MHDPPAPAGRKGKKKVYQQVKAFHGDDRVEDSDNFIKEYCRSGMPWRPSPDTLITEIHTCPLPFHWTPRGGAKARSFTNRVGDTSYFYDCSIAGCRASLKQEVKPAANLVIVSRSEDIHSHHIDARRSKQTQHVQASLHYVREFHNHVFRGDSYHCNVITDMMPITRKCRGHLQLSLDTRP